MTKLQPIVIKIPSNLKKSLDKIIKKFGLSRRFIVETALREKIEDILDSFDLKEAKDSTKKGTFDEVFGILDKKTSNELLTHIHSSRKKSTRFNT